MKEVKEEEEEEEEEEENEEEDNGKDNKFLYVANKIPKTFLTGGMFNTSFCIQS